MLKESSVANLVASEKESARLDFKAEFDTASKHDWCEIVKDVVAMANTRGGVIVIGIDDSGEAAESDLSLAKKLDPATVTDKVACYTGVQFADISLQSVERHGRMFPAIIVGRATTPIVFNKPGTYPTQNEKQPQKTAFSVGTVYVRHGAKSEPATTDDLRAFIDARIERIARKWRKGIRSVVTAPPDHRVQVVPPNMKLVPAESGSQVRLVNDSTAPAAHFLHPDETHPYRQKELVLEMCKRLQEKAKPTGYDIQCVRRVHKTDDNPTFTYAPKYASRQYSVAFAEWIVEQFAADPEFFSKACQTVRSQGTNRVTNKPR